MSAFDGPGSRRVTQDKRPDLKQFRVRVENPFIDCHAMEMWVEGDNILAVGERIMEVLSHLGISQGQVTKLVEIERGE